MRIFICFLTFRWGFFVHCVTFCFEFESPHCTQQKALKFIWIQEKFIPRLTFNLGLALTDFRTTRTCLQQVNLTWAHDPIESRHLAVTSRCSKLEPAIWPRDTGLRIPCLDRCQLITTGISYIKEGRCKPRLHVSVNLFAILTRPRGNSLAMITMKKSIHGLRDDRKTEGLLTSFC